jgi:hypothetical protein
VVTGRATEAGATVRVSFDPHRRVSPKLDGEPTPWITLSVALLLLGLASLLARHGVKPPENDAA